MLQRWSRRIRLLSAMLLLLNSLSPVVLPATAAAAAPLPQRSPSTKTTPQPNLNVPSPETAAENDALAGLGVTLQHLNPNGTTTHVTAAADAALASLTDEPQSLVGTASKPLRFTSGEHMLSFSPSHAYFVTAQRMVSVAFVGTQGVQPNGAAANPFAAAKAAPELGQVTYNGLWPGIDLRYEPAAEGLAKSTYSLAPGARVDAIQLRYNTPASVQADGSLRMALPDGQGYLAESAPVAWQELPGGRSPVTVAFAVSADGTVGFDVGSYDPRLPLVIDPTFSWHIFIATAPSCSTSSFDSAVDADGNLYIAHVDCATLAAPLHPAAGGYDIHVLKISSVGTLLWHTFYGTAGRDLPGSLSLDATGNVYIAGTSDASWLGDGNTAPLHAFSGSNDIVVLKLNSDGAYQWHTFYGSAGAEYGNAIVVDSSGTAYITGDTSASWQGDGNAPPLAPLSGFSGLFLIKLNSAGAYQWHTFVAEPDASEIALDAANNIYIAGVSTSFNGPGNTPPLNPYQGGFVDMVVVKLNSAGAYQWHTFQGGTGFDAADIMATDSAGNIYLSGRTTNWGTPLHAHSGGADFALIKLNSNGAYQWHTYYGSAGDDGATEIDVEGNSIYLGGGSDSSWLGDAATAPLNPHSAGANYDLTVLRLDSSGRYVWHAFYGSTSNEYSANVNLVGRTIYVSGNGNYAWNGPGNQPPLRTAPGTSIVVIKLGDTASSLDVGVSGPGSVLIDPPGSTCTAASCFERYTTLTPITLTATPLITATFERWDGDCSGQSAACTITPSLVTTATAVFKLAAPVTLVHAPEPSVLSKPFTVTYTLGPAEGKTPTGAVTVETSLGTSCIRSAPSLNCPFTPLAAGSVVVTSTYGGDAFFGSSQRVITHTVDKGDTTTAIGSVTPASSVTGQPLTVNYTLAVSPTGSGTPTGTMQLAATGGATSSCPVTALSGSCVVTPTVIGSVVLTASYSGNSNFRPSFATSNRTVTKASTTFAFTTNPASPSLPYQPITITFVPSVVAPGGGTPSGLVSVTDTQGNSCAATLLVGSCVITPTLYGVPIITAAYAGDANYQGSQSSTPYTIGRLGVAPTTLTITADLPDPSVVGQQVTVSYTVAAAAGTPSGTVIVVDNEGNSCSATVAAGSCALPLTSTGAKILYAAYIGDASYNASQKTVSHTVTKANTVVAVVAALPEPSVIGRDPVKVYYTVQGKFPGSGTPSGSVSVVDSDGNTCSGTIAAGFCTLPPSPVRDDLVGTKTITASFGGDASYNAGFGTAAHQVVDVPPAGTQLRADSLIQMSTPASFTATLSAGTNAVYRWNFDDGRTFTNTTGTITHTFGATGTYTASVSAENGNGTDQASQVLNVVDRSIKNLVGFVQNPINPVGATVAFTATTYDGTNVEYEWDMGDGSARTQGATTSHVYDHVGVYTVTLRARNGTSSASVVLPQTIRSPLVGLSAGGPSSLSFGEVAIFTATVQSGRDVVYTWDFGDGSPLVTGDYLLKYTYTRVGAFTVTVQASNGASTLEQRIPVQVNEVPISGLNLVGSLTTKIDETSYLTASVAGGTNVVYRWDFGDGTVEEGRQGAVSHLYDPPLGITRSVEYSVTLTAINAAGNITTTMPVIVAPVRRIRQVANKDIEADRFFTLEDGSVRAVGNVRFLGDRNWENYILVKGISAEAIYNLRNDTLELTGDIWAHTTVLGGISQFVGRGQLRGRLSQGYMYPVAGKFQIVNRTLDIVGFKFQDARVGIVELPEGGNSKKRFWRVAGDSSSMLVTAPGYNLVVPTYDWAIYSGYLTDRGEFRIALEARVNHKAFEFTIANTKFSLPAAISTMNPYYKTIDFPRPYVDLPPSLGLPTRQYAVDDRHLFLEQQYVQLQPNAIKLLLARHDGLPRMHGTTLKMDEVFYEIVTRGPGNYILQLFAKKLTLDLPDNKGSVSCGHPFTYSDYPGPFPVCNAGYVDSDGSYKFDNPSSLDLKVSDLSVTLSSPQISFNNGVTAAQGKVTQPAEKGGGSIEWTNIAYGTSGLTVNGSGIVPLPDVRYPGGYEVNGITVDLKLTGSPPRFEIVSKTGTAKAPSIPTISSGPISVKEISPNGTPILNDIVIKVAFFDLTLYDPVLLPKGGMYANTGSIRVSPRYSEKLGQVSLPVFDIGLDKQGLLDADKEFGLPPILSGRFQLADLNGKIKRTKDGYDVSAEGGFQFSNVKGQKGGTPKLKIKAGCTGLGVGVTFGVDTVNNGGTIEFGDPQFNSASLKIYCSIPIDTTGFAITQVRGGFTIEDDSVEITVGMTISDQFIGIIDLEGDVTWKPKDSEITTKGLVKLFSSLEIGGANGLITTERYSSTYWIEYGITEGYSAVQSWPDETGFNLAGYGKAKVRIRQGAIIKAPFYAPDVPSRDITIAEADAALGSFKIAQGQGYRTENGLKGQVNIPAIGRYGLFINDDGDVTWENVERYTLKVPPPRPQSLSGVESVSPQSGEPISYTLLADIGQAETATFAMAGLVDGATLTLRDPSNTLVSANSLPTGVTYLENNAYARFNPGLAPAGSARLRLVTAVPGAAPVRLLVDGTPLGEQQGFGLAGAYNTVGVGTHALTAIDTNGTVLASATVNAASQADYTLTLAGTPAAATLVVLTDDANATNRLPASGALVRLVNLVPATTFGLHIARSERLVKNVGYQQSSEYGEVDAELMPLIVSDNETSKPYAKATNTALANGQAYSVFALPGGAMLVQNDTSVAARLRAVNAMADGRAIDLYVTANGTERLLVGNLSAGTAASYAVVPGATTARVTPAGDAITTFFSTPLALAPNGLYTLAAVMSGPLLLSDSQQVPESGQARLRVVNLTANGPLSARAAEYNLPLARDLAAGTAAPYASLPGGNATLELRGGGDELLAALPNSALRDGQNYTIFALPNGTATTALLLADLETVRKTQQYFIVQNPQQGQWQVIVDGVTAPSDYALEVLGTVPPPATQNFSFTPSGAEQIQATWTLTGTTPDTRISLHAYNGAITHTSEALVDASGLTHSVVITDYAGPALLSYRTLTETNFVANGTPQTVSASLGKLPSGSYRVWLSIDDGRNPPVNLYAPSTLTVAPRAWDTSWTPTITATPGIENVDLAWSRHPDPDVDEYAVLVSGPTISGTDVISVGHLFDTSFGNLDPSGTYSFTLRAYSSKRNLTAVTPLVTAQPLNAPLTLSAPGGATLATEPGGTVDTMLRLSTPLDEYPRGVRFSYDLPLGVTVAITNALVTPTQAGLEVPLRVSVAEGFRVGRIQFPVRVQGIGAASTLTLTLDVGGQPLTVTPVGEGEGQVTSDALVGIDCEVAGDQCMALVNSGTVVKLTASAARGSTFVGWSDACAGSDATCEVTLDGAKTVTATFRPSSYTLQVDKTGGGTVQSTPAGIDCGGDCSETLAASSVLTLTATPEPGRVFAGWSGACDTVLETCVVAVNQDSVVTATFLQTPTVVLLGKAGAGKGTISSTPAGLTCDADCDDSGGYFERGSVVTLTASPAIGSYLASWSDACTVQGGACVVRLDAAKEVTASFGLSALPAISSASRATFTVGRPGLFTVTGTGVPTPTLSVRGLPSWLRFEPSTGQLTGTPPTDSARQYQLTITAANTAGSVDQAFTLVVIPKEGLPQVFLPAIFRR